jgi:hypothetical protein
VDRDELDLNTWIVIGNLLHSLLGGPAALTVAGQDRVQAERLQVSLARLQPKAIVRAVQDLPAEDRRFLRQAAERAYRLLGNEAASVIGVEQETALPVLDLLDGD